MHTFARASLLAIFFGIFITGQPASSGEKYPQRIERWERGELKDLFDEKNAQVPVDVCVINPDLKRCRCYAFPNKCGEEIQGFSGQFQIASYSFR